MGDRENDRKECPRLYKRDSDSHLSTIFNVDILSVTTCYFIHSAIYYGNLTVKRALFHRLSNSVDTYKCTGEDVDEGIWVDRLGTTEHHIEGI